MNEQNVTIVELKMLNKILADVNVDCSTAHSAQGTREAATT